jgi:hypothetical protein
MLVWGDEMKTRAINYDIKLVFEVDRSSDIRQNERAHVSKVLHLFSGRGDGLWGNVDSRDTESATG